MRAGCSRSSGHCGATRPCPTSSGRKPSAGSSSGSMSTVRRSSPPIRSRTRTPGCWARGGQGGTLAHATSDWTGRGERSQASGTDLCVPVTFRLIGFRRPRWSPVDGSGRPPRTRPAGCRRRRSGDARRSTRPPKPRSRGVKQTLSERCRVGRWPRMTCTLRQTLQLSVKLSGSNSAGRVSASQA